MRKVHKQHYACALKIASEQRATDFKPGNSWFVVQVVSETALIFTLIYRRVAQEGKERSAPVAN